MEKTRPFLKRNRKAFLNEKEKEMREKLSERNEISRRILPDGEVINIRDEAEKNCTAEPGIRAKVGIDLNDKVKGGILRTIRKIPPLKDVGKDGTPPKSEYEEPIHYLPIRLPVR